MPEPHISKEGEGHVFGSPTGDYMSLICFLNGSLSREKVKDLYFPPEGSNTFGRVVGPGSGDTLPKVLEPSGGGTWDQFSDALRRTKPGNGGRVMLPYFSPEITPKVLQPGVRRYWLDESDAAGNVRAVVEAQMASMALHSKWMGVKTRTIYATGGASSNRAILEIIANVHNADVYQFQVGKSAALGAALRAAHADLKASGNEMPWPQVVQGFAEPIAESRVRPDKPAVKVYREFLKLYKACEDHALRGGPNPASSQQRFLAQKD
jgi:xylulokinase